MKYRLLATMLVVGSCVGCVATVKTTSTTGPQPPPPQGGTVASSQHPAYLHALSDLRAARAYLEKPASVASRWDQNTAIREIDAAIGEIRQAAIDDGKPLSDHPPVDVNELWGSRLHRALELVQAAHRDVSQDEDNGYANGLKNRAISHIDLSARYIEQGMTDAQANPQPVAPPPAQHPAYLHALSDLRYARYLLARPANVNVRWDENSAIREIDAAMAEIRQAAIDDGKPLDDHPPVDANLEWGGRLQKALDLVEASRNDVNQREDNAYAGGLKNRSVQHLDAAARFVREGIEDSRRPTTPPATGGDHPAYLHALSDMRLARALLERPAEVDVKWDESRAIRDIDAAIHEINQAAIDDHKPLTDHPPVDVKQRHRDRLRTAMDLLSGAARDIEQREDNTYAKGLRARAVRHIRAAEGAIRDAMKDRADTKTNKR